MCVLLADEGVTSRFRCATCFGVLCMVPLSGARCCEHWCYALLACMSTGNRPLLRTTLPADNPNQLPVDAPLLGHGGEARESVSSKACALGAPRHVAFWRVWQCRRTHGGVAVSWGGVLCVGTCEGCLIPTTRAHVLDLTCDTGNNEPAPPKCNQGPGAGHPAGVIESLTALASAACTSVLGRVLRADLQRKCFFANAHVLAAPNK